MARSAKTRHVLDLVGSDSSKKALSPSLQEPQGKTPPQLRHFPIPGIAEEMSELTELSREDYNAKPQSEPKREEAAEQTPERGITVIVAELINQELEKVVTRFNLAPTDSNLWELTRSAIETIRPEFSRNEEEYLEKCERLRPRVIKEMTKAAVKLAAKDKKQKME